MSRAVIDQPGVRVLVIGLALSAFIGLALRSQISDRRIQGYLNKAIDRLQPDFKVDYHSAKVNLTRWGLPLPALVIEKLRLSPKNILCQSSQIYVEELEVPISLTSILGLSHAIPKIRTKEIELRLTDIEKCIGHKKPVEKKQNMVTQPTEVSTESGESLQGANLKDIFTNKTRAELKEVYIEKLKIISSKRPDQPVLLRQINVELFYKENKLSELQLKSKMNALKDLKSDVYYLNSDLNAFFKATENNNIESVINIKGKLLDGNVQLFTHTNSQSNKISYEMSVGHVSAKALIPIIENLQKNKNLNLDKIPISMSFENQGEIILIDTVSIDSKFKNIKLIIESGVMAVKELELNYQKNQLDVKPFEVNIDSLPLSSLKNIEEFKNKLDSLESLGTLSGKFDFKNQNSYSAVGQIKNINVIFSNRGRRDLQNIDNVEINISRNFNILKFNASNFIINAQNIDGAFAATYKVNTFDIEARLYMKDVSLNNQIWEQFTFVEQSPKMQILWNYKKNNNEVHNIKISADQIRLPGIKMSDLDIDLNQTISDQNESNHLNVSIKPALFATDEDFFQNEHVNKIANAAVTFKNMTINSNKTNLIITGSNWKNVNFSADSSFFTDTGNKSEGRINLKGTVKYQEGLNARLNLVRRDFMYKFDISKTPDSDIKIQPIQ